MNVLEQQYGFCLLEVLLAWSLVVMVSLAIFTLQSESIQQLQENRLYQVAIQGASNIAEFCHFQKKCDQQNQLYQHILHQIEQQLPNLNSMLSCHNKSCQLKLSWFKRHNFHYELAFSL